MCTTLRQSTEPFSFSLLQSLLRYEPETGKLYWLPRPQRMFISTRIHRAWNARWANSEAFTAKCHAGYTSGALFGKTYRGHRIIMALQIGRWLLDDEFVDHINGDRGDNRAVNIRIVTRQQNMRNIRTPRNSSSGRVGVAFSPRKGMWRAYMFGRHLGYAPDFSAAVALREAAEHTNTFTIRQSTEGSTQ